MATLNRNSRFFRSDSASNRSHLEKARDIVSVRDYISTAIDGTTSNQAGIEAAVTAALAAGATLYWPSGPLYVSTANIPNFHSVRHIGEGRIKRSANTFYITPTASQTNNFYIATTGVSTNDGLTSSQPLATFQQAFDVLNIWAKPVLDGTWQVSAAAGTYDCSAGQQTYSTPSRNRVIFKGPAAGHPNVPTCILDGGGNGTAYSHGLSLTDIGTRVLIQDIKFQNFSEASGNTRIGLVGDNDCDLYTINVHTYNCSWTGIYASHTSHALIAGGILDGAGTSAYGFVVKVSECSVGYGATNTSQGVVVKNCLSSGVYWSRGSQGHMDYCILEDNAVGFNVSENSRCDIVGNNFKRNTVAIRATTGGLYGTIVPTVFNDGTADANGTNVENKAYSGDNIELSSSATWSRVAYDRTARTLSGTTPTTLATPYTIPAHRMSGVGKSVRVVSYGVMTAITANSTMSVLFGGMTFTVTVAGAATNVSFELDVTLNEVAGGYRATGKLAQGVNQFRYSTATASFDKTIDQAISIGATLAGAGDSIAIYRTDVWLIG